MSEITIAIFKKILVILIFVTAVLPVLVVIINFIQTVFSVIPVFAQAYIRMGLGVFVFRIVKGLMSDA